MRKVNVSRFDVSDYLRDDESIAAYLNAALEEGDADLLMAAISDIAKAVGVAHVADAAGLGRESLYKTLAAGSKPRMDTVFKLLDALNIRLIASPQQTDSTDVKSSDEPLKRAPRKRRSAEPIIGASQSDKA
ncbi:protein of unknown function [Pararobbsia alpina]|uniref:addiction module antidote protein n=1 Tax=Pararobbsia alpina TaxID=621374 RepID=UPI0039A5F491